MSPPVSKRNQILDALFGHPEYSYGFDPLSSSVFRMTLYIGDPALGGVPVSAPGYADIFVSTGSYYDAFDGVYKAQYFPPLYEWGPAAETWGDVTHLVLSVDDELWSIPLSMTYSMLIGSILRLSLPNVYWTIDDPTFMSGPTVELRRRILTSLFGNSFMPSEVLAPTEWDFALFVGDPDSGGVEPAGWDYLRVSYLNDTGYFDWSGSDGYQIATTAPAGIVWPFCQTDWGLITHWAMYAQGTNVRYHSGPITSHPSGLDAVAGTRVSIPVGDWVAHLGEPV